MKDRNSKAGHAQGVSTLMTEVQKYLRGLSEAEYVALETLVSRMTEASVYANYARAMEECGRAEIVRAVGLCCVWKVVQDHGCGSLPSVN
jgi:replicative DNA helicase